MTTMIRIFGSCNAKTRIGGYSAIINNKQIGGGATDTTAKRMELTALIKAIKTMKKTADKQTVLFYCRSNYIKNGMANYRNYIANGMHSVGGSVIANQDLWNELIATAKDRNVFIKAL